MHDFLFLGSHRTKRVEELPIPHDCGVHDDLIDHFVGLGDELAVLMPLDPSYVSSACGALRSLSVCSLSRIGGLLLF